MKRIKILNCYAGIGGNRKKWKGDIEVTAVENNKEIAEVYSHFFPDDAVVVGDAHQYLLEHFKEFDFIWSSPPCFSHSCIRKAGSLNERYPVIYPDISLWQEISLLKHYVKKKNIAWTVENVNPYYNPIVKPNTYIGKNVFWSNFRIPKIKLNTEKQIGDTSSNNTIYGFNISNFEMENKRQILRNLVNPKIGEHIFKAMLKHKNKGLGLIK